ncbi:hypothetical protein IP70_19910 [alpha proteobacterium AAP38]|nr:hypothetical protein IP70_19910 [alpha proteobacterium AAP38]
MVRQARQRPSRRDRKAQADMKGKLLIGLVGLVFALAVFAYVQAVGGKVKVNAETLCPEAGPVSVTAFVIDRTDSVTPVQRQLLTTRFEETRQSVPKHGLLQIYTVGPIKADVLKPDFSLCNPGSGEDLSQWTANPRLAKRTWATVFDQPLRHVLDGMLEAGQADQSPIMETIQSVASTAFAPYADAADKNLVVVSDLLQHSEAASQYKGAPAFESFKGTAAYRKVKANLSDVNVQVLYIRRETGKTIQGASHIGFWSSYFVDQGASDFRAESIF